MNLIDVPLTLNTLHYSTGFFQFCNDQISTDTEKVLDILSRNTKVIILRFTNPFQNLRGTLGSANQSEPF